MKKENKKQNTGVKPIPEGYHTVTPFVVVNDASGFIDFTQKAFDAELPFILKDDDTGKVIHATIKIGDSIVMVSDVMKDMESRTCMLYLYLEDVDTVYKKAIDARATPTREVRDEFYGDRAGCVTDAWGNAWWISTHIEDVSDEELSRRKDQMSGQPA